MSFKKPSRIGSGEGSGTGRTHPLQQHRDRMGTGVSGGDRATFSTPSSTSTSTSPVHARQRMTVQSLHSLDGNLPLGHAGLNAASKKTRIHHDASASSSSYTSSVSAVSAMSIAPFIPATVTREGAENETGPRLGSSDLSISLSDLDSDPHLVLRVEASTEEAIHVCMRLLSSYSSSKHVNNANKNLLHSHSSPSLLQSYKDNNSNNSNNSYSSIKLHRNYAIAINWIARLVASLPPLHYSKKKIAPPSSLSSNSASASSSSSSSKKLDPNELRIDSAHLANWLAALTHCVSALGNPVARPIVDAVLSMQRWYHYYPLLDDTSRFVEGQLRMAKEFRALVENLVSAHAFLVQPVVGAFVAALRNARHGKEGPATLSIKYDRIHNVLSSVIRLIPTGLTFMTTILNEYFPHKTEDVADNVWYTKNLMRIVSYAPVLRNAVWAIVIDRMMQMDVEIQGALEKLDEEEYSTVLAHCFEIDSASVDPEMISFMSPKTFATAGRVGGAAPDELRLDDFDQDDVLGSLDENNEEDDAESASDEEEVDDEDEDDDEDDDDEDAPVIVSDFRKMSGRLDSMLHYLMTQVTEVFNSSAAYRKATMAVESAAASGLRGKPKSPPPSSSPPSIDKQNTPPEALDQDLEAGTTSSLRRNSITNEESFEFFSVLLQIFERTVLPTHQCKYVQFLYFHATSLSQSCTEHFLVRLAQRTFDTGSPALLRVAASAYLSSFVARAKFVRPDNVMYCIKMLNSWALSYVEEYEPTLKVTSGGVVVMEGGGKMQHTVFYAVVQALLYVFCFRWREIVDSSVGVGSGGVPAEMNGFQRIVMSKFAPMSVCSRTVVAEFARITHKLDMMYVYAHMQGQQVVMQSQNHLMPPRGAQSTSSTAAAASSRPAPMKINQSAAINSHSMSMSFGGASYAPASDDLDYAMEETSTTPTNPPERMSFAMAAAPRPLNESNHQQQHQQQPPLPRAQHPQETFEFVQQVYQPMEVAAGEYLEAFFPFDPCHLLLSKRLIERHYNEWSEEEETAASSVPNGGAGGKGFDSDVDFISHSFENQMSLSAD